MSAALLRSGLAALTLLAVWVAPLAAQVAVPLGTCGPIARRYSAVEVVGAQLRRLGGPPIARLALVAFHNGRPAPIPFQVDERRGRKVALDEGEEPSADDRPGVLDADDLLVFMACDAGEARPPAEVAAAFPDTTAGPWREIRVEDPLAHKEAFAYLAVVDRPPSSDRRYVAYEPKGDFVATARYRIGMEHALPTYFALITGSAVGPNLIDGLRLRAEARLRADLAHWQLNETQGHHELIAWKAGPVRVVRRSRHRVVVGLGIRLTAGLANTYFYPQHVYGPGSLKLPFSPGILFSEITARGAVDGRDLRGWRYYASGAPARGFRIDGRMDQAERDFASSGDWFVLAHDDRAILFVTRMSENLRRGITLGLLYRDDASRPNPPERVPGTVPLVGYEGRGIDHLAGGRYTFALHVFTLEGYHRGDERAVLAELDTPLVASVTATGDLSDRAAPAAAREAAP